MKQSIMLELETSRSRTVQTGFKPEFEQKEIKIGDGVTIQYYSDRTPATIIEIADNGSYIIVQEDTAIRTDNGGMSDCQDYDYKRNENGIIHKFKRTRKNKSVYTDTGTYCDYGIKLSFYGRQKYHDYSF